MKPLKHLHVFNPDCELAIANGSKYYTPPTRIVQMAKDLAFLPAWLAEREDYILVDHLPEQSFLTTLENIGVTCKPVLPEMVRALLPLKPSPWGWSPKICYQFSALNLETIWHSGQKEWYSRKLAREGLLNLLNRLPYIETHIVPVVCSALQELEQKTADGKYVAKAPWSSSGKGLLILNRTLIGKEKEWLTGMLRRQGYLMLEPYLDKVFDFAMEFRKEGGKIDFIGWSAFQTGETGEYRGNYLGAQEKIFHRIAGYIGKEKIIELTEALPEMLTRILPEAYEGYVGVDMMIYKGTDEKYKLQPCVEINLRCNMGVIAYNITRKYLDEQSEGWFFIRYYAGKGEAMAEHVRMRQEHPTIYKNNRILSGYFNLTPVEKTTHFLSFLLCD